MLEHGSAPYQFRTRESMSYYVKLATARGVRVLWGTDLHRALHRAVTRPQIGDAVGARRVRRDPVTLRPREGEAKGPPSSAGQSTVPAAQSVYRTTWEVEKLTHFGRRARQARLIRDRHLDVRQAVRAHPELKDTFISLRAAENYAERRIANAEDRAEFLERLRQAIGASHAKGVPLPDVRLRGAPARPEGKPSREPRKDPPTR